MKTILLYEKDSFTKEFTAKVLECRVTETGYQVMLDQTAFFPEGGGQTADTGVLWTMDDSGEKITVQVRDVQEIEGEIWHMTDLALEEAYEVKGQIHWQERFSKMQHHSGEHIVSGLVHRHFGYHNVGFHLGSQTVTLDFDGVLNKEQLRQIEWEANEAVACDVPIVVTYPTREELAQLSYRSKKEILGQVRIVEIPGYDVCACCAPHLHTTGQIGIIKLTDIQSCRGGVRVTMRCGFGALRDYNEKEESVRGISQLLSAREDRVVAAVERLKQEIYQLKGEKMALEASLLTYKVKEVVPGTECEVLIEHNLSGNQPRELVNQLLDRQVKIAGVFFGNDGQGYRYVLGSHCEDVRPLAKKINEVLSGRGGGSREMVQGAVACGGEEIQEFFRS